MDSDPEIEVIDKDSGLSSLGGSKDETPERKELTMATIEDIDETHQSSDNFDDEPDETLSERLWGLSEMFPESMRQICGTVTSYSASGIKGLYSFTCNASWIMLTSSMILFAPVIFETERAQMEEMQRSQQKQVLLGPGSAMAPGGTGLPSMPPMAR